MQPIIVWHPSDPPDQPAPTAPQRSSGPRMCKSHVFHLCVQLLQVTRTPAATQAYSMLHCCWLANYLPAPLTAPPPYAALPSPLWPHHCHTILCHSSPPQPVGQAPPFPPGPLHLVRGWPALLQSVQRTALLMARGAGKRWVRNGLHSCPSCLCAHLACLCATCIIAGVTANANRRSYSSTTSLCFTPTRHQFHACQHACLLAYLCGWIACLPALWLPASPPTCLLAHFPATYLHASLACLCATWLHIMR